MDSRIDPQANDLAESCFADQISRRSFVTGLLALGFAPGAIRSIVFGAGGSSAPKALQGTVRFLIGPWSNQEVAHQQHTAKAFQALHPKVTSRSGCTTGAPRRQQINTSVIEGAQDIYMTTESSYPGLRGAQHLRRSRPAHQRSVLRRGEGQVPLSWTGSSPTARRSSASRSAGTSRTQCSSTWTWSNAAGFDESFADTWHTFLEAVTKMTKPGKTYGFGIGIQIGGYAEWYQRLRAAGGLVSDSRPQDRERQPSATSSWRHSSSPISSRRRSRRRSAPTRTTTHRLRSPPARWRSTPPTSPRRRRCPKKVPFNWKLLPYPPGPVSRVNFNDSEPVHDQPEVDRTRT